MGSPSTLECSRVCDQGTKAHVQAEIQVTGLIFPQRKLQIPSLSGEPAAPVVQSSPASAHPAAVGYTLPKECHRAKGAPSGLG